MSLVELVIVLGISSILIAGSFAWFQSRGGTVFYDQMRQIDAYVRQIQSEADSQYVQGFSGNASCIKYDDRDPLTTTCPLAQKEQVFGVALMAQVPIAGQQTILTSLRLKRDSTATNVTDFGGASAAGPSYQVDRGVKFVGYGTTGTTSNCNTTDRAWATIPGALRRTTPGNTAAIVFRQQPRTIYAVPNPTASTPLTSYGGDDPQTASIGRDCSMVLHFESVEQISPGVARYMADVQIQPGFGTTRIVTQ